MCSVSGQSVSPYAKCQQFHSSSTESAVEQNTKEGKVRVGEIILIFLFIASYTSYDSKMITELSFCWSNKEQRGHLAPAAPWDVISHIISKVCQNCQSFLSSLHFPLPGRGLVWLQIRCHHTWLGWAGLGWARPYACQMKPVSEQ